MKKKLEKFWLIADIALDVKIKTVYCLIL